MQTASVNMKRQLALQRHEKMSLAQWLQVPENPRQRNTERHARSAEKNHLSEPSLTHLEVSAAEMPDGKLLKLDGHTRAYLWREGRLGIIGNMLNVTIYPVSNEKEAKELYLHFDNQKAAETAGDRGYGALKEAGIVAKTQFIAEGKIKVAIGLAEYARTGSKADISINHAVKEWKTEIIMFDDIRVPGMKINSWIFGAGLITLRKRGERAADFWDKYARDQGVKTDSGRDGVEMLTQYVLQARDRRQVGSSWAETHAPKAVAACEGFLSGYYFSVALKPKDIVSYLRQ